jgi:hypothetical protein
MIQQDLAYGHLCIDFNDDEICVNIWNFVAGKQLLFKLMAEEFGEFQDFGLTFEHIFLLFAIDQDVKVIGFDSSKNVSILILIN